jgi:hypothetical protein
MLLLGLAGAPPAPGAPRGACGLARWFARIDEVFGSTGSGFARFRFLPVTPALDIGS